MKTGFPLLISPLFALFLSCSGSQAGESTLQLDEAVSLAIKNSPALRAAQYATAAARSSASAAQSSRLPKLSIDGSYRLQSIVPEVTVGPKTLQLTDDHNYSIGPTLSATLWDSGLKCGYVRSLEAIADSRTAQEDLTGAQIKLSTRMAYVQSALAAATYEAALQSESLSRTQNKDIRARSQQGAASRLDTLSSDAEVLNYGLKAKQSESELQANLADLHYYLGNEAPQTFQLQSLEELSARLVSPKSPKNPTHPLARIQEGVERAATAQSESLAAAYWPIINVQLRSSFDYPNGPSFNEIQQNSAMVQFTWSLFEFGAVRKQIAAKESEARAASEQKTDILAGLARDIEKATSRLNGLRDQLQGAEQLVQKQSELARMNYENYRYGKLSFPEVQTANLRLLEAKTRLAGLRSQYLAQHFNLEFLIERE